MRNRIIEYTGFTIGGIIAGYLIAIPVDVFIYGLQHFLPHG